jgi:hypothetical protein
MLKLTKPTKQLEREVKFYERFGAWAVIMSVKGPVHAAHLHVSTYGKPDAPEYSAGLEMHYATPPEHRVNDVPDHRDCPFTGGKCWHEGTSTGADQAKAAVQQGLYALAMEELERFYQSHAGNHVESIWMEWAKLSNECEAASKDITELIDLLPPKKKAAFMKDKIVW